MGVDPENLRTIVSGLVTAAVGLVPAVLLYRQNRDSGKRESEDRREERAAEDRRREKDLAYERLRLEAEGHQTAVDREREPYVRFLKSVEQISLGVLSTDALGHVHIVTENDASN